MPPFSLAQSKSVPMKTRMHLKLERIMISKSEEEEQRHKRRVDDEGPMLRRSQSSPTLGSLSGATWTWGRGKGGRKLGVGGGLVKNPQIRWILRNGQEGSRYPIKTRSGSAGRRVTVSTKVWQAARARVPL